MRKRTLFVVAVIALITVLAMSSCSGGSRLGVSENTEKMMTIEANNAAKDDFLMTGSLVLGEKEKVAMTAELEKGGIRIELYAEPEEQSIDEVPDYDSMEPIIMFNASGNSSQSGELNPGEYMVKATVTEKASGTVQIDVLPE